MANAEQTVLVTQPTWGVSTYVHICINMCLDGARYSCNSGRVLAVAGYRRRERPAGMAS
jgi:hypothetical protein